MSSVPSSTAASSSMRIHMYLREFPAQGDRLISGMIKAVHGLAAGFAANGARVTVLCEGHATSRVVTPAGTTSAASRTTAQRGSSQSLPSGLRDYLLGAGRGPGHRRAQQRVQPQRLPRLAACCGA